MKLEVNPRTGSLAHRVKDDFRLLSQDTRSLLHQALSDELPTVRTKLANAASEKLDQGRQLLSKGRRIAREDLRLPLAAGSVVIGASALAVAALAGAAAWWFFRRNGTGSFERPIFSRGN